MLGMRRVPSDFDRYLSPEALTKLSVSIHGKSSDDVDQQAYVMYDGTVITIERAKDKTLKTACLDNPKGIKISNTTRVTVKYTVGDEEKNVTFITKSMQELCSKWKAFKSAKQYDSDLYGTIDSIDLTEQQKLHIIDMEDIMNDIVNYMLDDDLMLGEDESDPILAERYSIVNQLITNAANFMIVNGFAEKVHVPHLRRNAGEPVELREYITTDILFGEFGG